ncbi:MAG: VWA domain-containing protein [Bacteriovoracaceae bacterium]|nr:VWA domain-containing protein [Bacteriovoracaceae bacterium]
MVKRREVNIFSLSFLDIISGALGAVIILYVAVPKGNPLESQLDKVVSDVKNKDAKIQELQNELEQLRELRESAQKAIQENEDFKAQVQPVVVEEEKKEDSGVADGQGLEVGFKFKGKSIVFILDTSKSMMYEDQGHDRMGQVKAGLKMLIMSMPSNFNVEVVQFPNSDRSPYRALFGKLKRLNKETKLDVIDYVYGLKPYGGTPTRDTLSYVFNQYKDMSDIVLLTDGEPSLHNSNIKDDIFEILNNVRKWNANSHVQINTIGVGDDVLHDKTGKPYQFLRLLAEQNTGFFVGF